MRRDPKWIDVEAAKQLAGKDTYKALRRFIERWNHDNLDNLILCIPGKVDEHTLRYAVRRHTEKHTPGMGLRKQLESSSRRGSRLVAKQGRA